MAKPRAPSHKAPAAIDTPGRMPIASFGNRPCHSQIGTTCPILHAEYDQVYPIALSDATGTAVSGTHLQRDGMAAFRLVCLCA
jgi:hypothetical protein